MPNTNLRLDRLYLRNFRCFSECMVELHPQLTVLVAENGCGKSAILNAIGIAFGLFIDTVSDTRKNADLAGTDVRLIPEEFFGAMTPTPPTEFHADGFVAGQSVHWSQALKGISPSHRPTTADAEELRQIAQQIREHVEQTLTDGTGDRPILPLVSFYGTDRHWSKLSATNGNRVAEQRRSGRMSGYSGCLSASSSVTDVVAWYENTAKQLRSPEYKTMLRVNLSLLTAVREATRVVLEPTGWSELDWDFDRNCLVVEHQDKRRLPLSVLSDGIRNTVALVADIARRCASLNPQLGEDAARQTPGVLLLDEVDMHLHPRWQQQVVELLQKAFPSMQMIISTHSPHVLSTVDMDSIRIIRFHNGDGLLETPKYQTRGVESADVLARIMDVDPVPQVAEAQLLSKYRALVQTNKYGTDDGHKIWNQLIGHFGKGHPLIFELETLHRLQEFMRAHDLTKKEDV
jgi:predicted ATP-binding protein involved in virulence